MQSDQWISVYYFQSEISFKHESFKAHFGMECMSGNDASTSLKFSKSFVPFYGVVWKFIGNMDYLTSSPSDLKNGSLTNPYFYLFKDFNMKISDRIRYSFILFTE